MKKAFFFILIFLLPLQITGQEERIISEDLRYDVWKIVVVAKANFTTSSIGNVHQISYNGKTTTLGWIISKLAGKKLIHKEGICTYNPQTGLPLEFHHFDRDLNRSQTWLINQAESVYHTSFNHGVLQSKTTHYLNGHNVHDILSALLYFRKHLINEWSPSEKDDSINMLVVNSSTVIQVPIIYLGKHDVKIRNQRFSTQLFDINIGSLGEQLFGGEGSLKMYCTTDSLHLPVKMMAKVKINGNLLDISANLNLERSFIPNYKP